jgi:hypothetical protein
MEATMKRALRALLVSALVLLAAGVFLYRLGSRINLEVEGANATLWEQAPGDKWLYIGGLMILVAGALSLAAVRVWLGRRGETSSSSLGGLNEH